MIKTIDSFLDAAHFASITERRSSSLHALFVAMLCAALGVAVLSTDHPLLAAWCGVLSCAAFLQFGLAVRAVARADRQAMDLALGKFDAYLGRFSASSLVLEVNNPSLDAETRNRVLLLLERRGHEPRGTVRRLEDLSKPQPPNTVIADAA